jgi:exopolysaccharide biosynthesis polyprenyl glycosylphosphotransferase
MGRFKRFASREDRQGGVATLERGTPPQPQAAVSGLAELNLDLSAISPVEAAGASLGAAPPLGSRAAVARTRLRRDSVYRRALGVADLVAATASVLVLGLVGRTELGPGSLLALPLAIVLCKLLGLYDRDERVLWSSTLDEAPRVIVMALVFTVSVWLAAGSLLPGHVHKGQFLLALITMIGGVLTGRMVARQAALAMTERERCLVLGEVASFERVRNRLKYGENGAAEMVLGIPVEPGGFDRLLEGGTLRTMVEEHAIKRLVIASSGHDTDSVLELIRQASGLDVKVSLLPNFWDTLGSLVVDEMPGTAMLAVRRFGLSKSSELVKRSFDLVLASVALVLLAPLFAFIGVLVHATSDGPVLFRQRRVGRHGQTFEILKFRTMRSDAETLRNGLAALNEAPGLFKIREDPRITPPGRWLRRTSLDELPQLVNVLKGEMSLVGPRPLIGEEDAGIVGWRRRRLDVPPGMTGHWQVLGGARVPLEEMVMIDYRYIANWSLWRDVKCLLRTVTCVLARRGI